MQKIALKNIPEWVAQGWHDCNSDWGNVVQFGAVAFGVNVAMQLVIKGFQLAGQALGNLELGGVVSLVAFFFYAAFIGCGLSGVALARLHGRDAEWDDFQQDVPTYFQAFLGDILASLALFLAMTAISGIFFIPVFTQAASGSGDGAIVVVSLILGTIAALLAFIFLYPLKLFIIPLTVDKRLDFWSAIRTSFDCVRRDWLGLTLFNLIAFLIYLPAYCCCLGLLFLAPLYYAIVMAAYRSYFGLEPDRNKPKWLMPVDKSAYFSQYDRPFGDYTGDRGDPGAAPADPARVRPWTPPPPPPSDSEAGPPMPPPKSGNIPPPPSFPFAPRPPAVPPFRQNDPGVEYLDDHPPKGPPPE